MDVSAITNLGVAGFAIFVIWKQSDRHARQLDERDASSRALEREIRDKIMTALANSTHAVTESTKTLAAFLSKGRR
jgi:hypothetical protein